MVIRTPRNTKFDDFALTRDEYELAHLLDGSYQSVQVYTQGTRFIEEQTKSFYTCESIGISQGIKLAFDTLKKSEDAQKISEHYPLLQHELYPQEPSEGYGKVVSSGGGDWGQLDPEMYSSVIYESHPLERGI